MLICVTNKHITGKRSVCMLSIDEVKSSSRVLMNTLGGSSSGCSWKYFVKGGDCPLVRSLCVDRKCEVIYDATIGHKA